MASENKKRKLKNSYCGGWALKNKSTKLKRVLFYNPSQRREDNRFPLPTEVWDKW